MGTDEWKKPYNNPKLKETIKVFLVIHQSSMMVMGCFDSKDKAKRYVNNCKDFWILKTKVL